MDTIKRLLNFRTVVLLILMLHTLNIYPKPRYEDKRDRYKRAWNKLIPSYTKLQYGGGMGLLSFGTGWSYGKHGQGETDIFFGFLPKYSSDRAKATFTLKRNYIPWSVQLYPKYSIEPFAVGGYFNTIFGSEFWTRQPHKYSKGYYQIPSKVRFHLYCGQRITFHIKNDRKVFLKKLSLFYELSSCDILVISRTGNKYLRPRDYFRLSFGIKA